MEFSTAELSLSAKQQELLQQLDAVIAKIGIEIDINRPIEGFPAIALAALDVEHDESGGFVGCGIYTGTGIVYYYSDLLSLSLLPFHTFSLICHNGVSDIECLNSWGINVSFEQLYFDTMLIGHIIDSSQRDYSLKGLAKRELNISYPSYDDIVGKKGLKTARITLDKQPLELVSKYNAIDTYITWALYEKQKNHS